MKKERRKIIKRINGLESELRNIMKQRKLNERNSNEIKRKRIDLIKSIITDPLILAIREN